MVHGRMNAPSTMTDKKPEVEHLQGENPPKEYVFDVAVTFF